MKGFVETPRATVDRMVMRLFAGRHPRSHDHVLDPGCGPGAFIDGVIRFCEQRGLQLPQITGIELDPQHLPVLREKYNRFDAVQIRCADFLATPVAKYDFIVGNPPYVAITSLTEREKTRYRARFTTAHGRFDLYLLFFEQALQSLASNGRLVFITPEKFIYVDSAGPLRSLLAKHEIEEIRLMREDTFGTLVTYPTVTVLRNSSPTLTRVIRRDRSRTTVTIPRGQGSWLPLLEGSRSQKSSACLGDACYRISCGVATGADAVFVRSSHDLDAAIQRFAYPTLAGRQLTPETRDLPEDFVMLVPYTDSGRLLPLKQLGVLGNHLMRDEIRSRLLARTCVKRKPWYAFHETPVLRDILRPKILCKDICEEPRFWIDRLGRFVPRHSIYYLVPRNPAAIDAIIDYLDSSSARRWLAQNCQRASKGYLRLQSRVLRRMPLPDEVAREAIGDAATTGTPTPARQASLAVTG